MVQNSAGKIINAKFYSICHSEHNQTDRTVQENPKRYQTVVKNRPKIIFQAKISHQKQNIFRQ